MNFARLVALFFSHCNSLQQHPVGKNFEDLNFITRNFYSQHCADPFFGLSLHILSDFEAF